MAWNSGYPVSEKPLQEKVSGASYTAVGLWPDKGRAASLRHSVNLTLKALLPPRAAPPVNLHTAMHYALLAPGKRLRPMLTLLTAGETQETQSPALQLACVSEIVHTASLILDDLPCMDDAKLRRNQPCTHLLFSESTAILASVNLLNLAYGVVAKCPSLHADVKIAISAHLSDVVGSMGLVGGQTEDLNGHGAPATSVQQLYHQKTGCLFEFAVVTGARMHRLDESRISALKLFARSFGLLFQIYDDVLDNGLFTGVTGKDTGKDLGKSTLLASHSPAQVAAVVADARTSVRHHLKQAELHDSPLAEFVEEHIAHFEQAGKKLGIYQ